MQNHGKIAGVPYDFRRPTLSRLKERVWNPDDPRVLTPRTYGIGWAINLPSLRKKSEAAFYLALLFYLVLLVGMLRDILRRARKLNERFSA